MLFVSDPAREIVSQMRRALTALTMVPVALLVSCRPSTSDDRVVLWAWERPEDLRFVDPEKVSVAALAATIHLKGSDATLSPRRQPLLTPAGTEVIGVVRIESDRGTPPDLSEAQLRLVIRMLQVIAEPVTSKRLQIDFDATAGERIFYRKLLVDLRATLPHPWHLSMTALASWCLSDRWISDLPVDEAVPMLFQMGPETPDIKHRLRDRDLAVPLCLTSVGLATNELITFREGRRVYLFHGRPWTKGAFDRAVQSLRDWSRSP